MGKIFAYRHGMTHIYIIIFAVHSFYHDLNTFENVILQKPFEVRKKNTKSNVIQCCGIMSFLFKLHTIKLCRSHILMSRR
jgi:hypothetical protein